MFGTQSLPRAILHIDGDCFFASCEIVKNPKLKGKPIVTGYERGIVSSMSYEAKRLGIKRGGKVADAKKICPDLIVVPSDYESYCLYSARMYNIVKRYTSEVEEFSIDECFADLTGLRRTLRMPYIKMAECIQHDLEKELGITFSIGLGPNKTIAKLASKWKKPNGLTLISIRKAHTFYKDMPIDKVCGIGPNTTAFMRTLGIRTVLDLANKDLRWIEQSKLSKPFKEIWTELRGGFITPIDLRIAHKYKSIMKVKTFSPASSDREFIFSQLSRHVEHLTERLRRYHMSARDLSFYLKTQEDFSYYRADMRFPYPTSSPEEMLKMIRPEFEKIFIPKLLYRATSISLSNFSDEDSVQLDLFGNALKSKSKKPLYDQIDKIARKYGKHSIFLGTSFQSVTGPYRDGELERLPERKLHLLKGETPRRRLGFPFLGIVVK